MKPLLIIQLFELYVRRSYPPDILSVEYGPDEDGINEKRFIRFEWFSGKVREFGYTNEAYGAIWKRFNEYWNSKPKELEAVKIYFN